jgi:glycosyltransferase involved in cell wall biosynthesis
MRAVHPTETPLVSVVIPTYNQARYLGDCIESVLAQSYPAVEIVVVDDGSTDATPDVLAGYGDRINQQRQSNQGAANALNRGIAASRGAFVCWLSSDDAFTPDKVALQVAAFLAEPSLGLSFMGFDAIDADGRFKADRSDLAWRHPDLLVSVFWANPINGSTVMMPRHVIDEIGPFNETLRADVDAEMWFRVLERYPAAHIPGVHLHYRVHSQALSANQGLMRHSKATVRGSVLRSGLLVRRLQANDRAGAPAVLAEMSTTFTGQGYHDLARGLLVASLRSGRAWPRQREALRVLAAAQVPTRLKLARRAKMPRPFRQARKAIRRVAGRSRPL